MGGDQEQGPGPGGHWAPAPTGGREVSVARKPSDHKDLIPTASNTSKGIVKFTNK